MFDEIRRAGGVTKTEIQPALMIRGPDDLDDAFATMARERADALVVQGSLVTKRLTDMAIKHRLPIASSTRVIAEIGGLMSFGADGPGALRHGARLVQRVLQGSSRRTCRSSSPPSSSWSSTSRPRRRSASPCRPSCSPRADEVIE